MQTVYLDTETYSDDDIKDVGTYQYIAGCELLSLHWGQDGQLWPRWEPELDPSAPKLLKEIATNPEIEVKAHNVTFDRGVVNKKLRELGLPEIPIERWKCTMASANRAGLPPSLQGFGEAIGLPDDQQKIKDGKRLVQKFCKPAPSNHKVDRYDRHNSPEDWQRFMDYGDNDVVAMMEADRRLPKWAESDAECAVFHIDQHINDLGLPVDLPAVHAAIELRDKLIEMYDERIRELTGGIVESHSKVKDIITFLKQKYDFNTPDLRKATLSELLTKDDLHPEVRELLELRRNASKSSTKKFDKMLQVISPDGRIRGTMQYYGANRTGRWAGRLIQPQNMPRPLIDDVDTAMEALLSGTLDLIYDNPMDVLASLVRPLIAAKEGFKFVVSDLAGIEARTLRWIAGDSKGLEVFIEGKDPYKVAAAGIYGIGYDEVTKDQRFIGKIATLSLGYQGGANAFIQMGREYGVEIDLSLAERTVKAWRAANPRIREFWNDLQNCAASAVQNPGKVYETGRIMFQREDRWLKMRLPSGRILAYFDPIIRDHQRFEGAKEIAFMGVDQTTRRWVRIGTYGGKLAENASQAVARDVLAANLRMIMEHGYRVVATVHDEVITEAPDLPDFNAEQLSTLMAKQPKWAEGLPLAAEGFETYRYRKD
jgi:DNA polymerase